ncbi:Predicted ATPase related to phosphate starvation-inducible protein PhoH [hydrothermal vent metagenome]|uniref:Predicted ATPase related to phosphate starvation-inducible protein PhoH n=1 Tax=hydrothermal vent metagenome TaxID=652676 RepID=A0A3B0TMP9_9ZZZZ
MSRSSNLVDVLPRNTTEDSVQRTYVLDTCVLLADPQAILRFDEHEVVLPLVVIEELDHQKTRMDEVGANARRAIRLLEEMGASQRGGLADPHRLPGGGSVRIELNGIYSDRLPDVLNPTTPDHRILATCLNIDDSGREAVLVTKDAALRIKGAQLQVTVEDYRGDTVVVDESYSGVTEVEVDADVIEEIYQSGKAVIPEYEGIINQYLILKGPGSASALARAAESGTDPVAVRVAGSRHLFGIETKNTRQAFATDLLMDPDITAVSLMGMAGTGKTFLSLAAALEQVIEIGRYRRVSVYRPLIAVGRQEVGFLPGDLTDKLEPWMAAVHDNLYALFGGDGANPRDMVEELFERDLLEMAAVTYLRGRSITGEIVIVDEAQNLELSTLKVILTRMGENSKVVFCGDLTQVDNPYVSPYGGLAALIEKFKGNPMFGHVTMERTVRSPLAELATKLL